MGGAPATVAGALALRAWALRVLADPDGAGPAPRTTAEGWHLFLRVERCALPLARRLGAPPVGAGAEVLQRRSLVEMQRALSARGVIHQVGRVLRERGWSGVVLKGGAGVLDGAEPLDLADVDLLVPRDRAAEVGRALEAAGYARVGADPPVDAHAVWHLAPRVAPGGVQVEVHFDLVLPGGAAVLEQAADSAVPGVRRATPADHLWHLLFHSVVAHLERRGALRDLLLVAQAVARCSPEELTDVRARVAASRAREALGAALEMAAALGSGAAPADRFAQVAAARYRLAATGRSLQWLSEEGQQTLGSAACALAAGGGEYRRLWAGTPWSALVPPVVRGRGLRGAAGRLLAWPARVLWRSTRLAALTPAAWWLSRLR